MLETSLSIIGVSFIWFSRGEKRYIILDLLPEAKIKKKVRLRKELVESDRPYGWHLDVHQSFKKVFLKFILFLQNRGLCLFNLCAWLDIFLNIKIQLQKKKKHVLPYDFLQMCRNVTLECAIYFLINFSRVYTRSKKNGRRELLLCDWIHFLGNY